MLNSDNQKKLRKNTMDAKIGFFGAAILVECITTSKDGLTCYKYILPSDLVTNHVTYFDNDLWGKQIKKAKSGELPEKLNEMGVDLSEYLGLSVFYDQKDGDLGSFKIYW